MLFRLTAHMAISTRRSTSLSHSRGQSSRNQLCFSFDNDIVISQLTRPLAAFVAEKVAAIRIPMRHFTRPGYLEPAFHSLVGLLFWHFFFSETSASRIATGKGTGRLYRFSVERAGEYNDNDSGL